MRALRKNAPERVLARVFDKAVRRKPIAFAADAELSMEFQSIVARKALPEAGFRKKAAIDDHRCMESRLLHDSAHRSPRPDHASSAQSLKSLMRLASGTR